jgi:hypothetical protein
MVRKSASSSPAPDARERRHDVRHKVKSSLHWITGAATAAVPQHSFKANRKRPSKESVARYAALFSSSTPAVISESGGGHEKEKGTDGGSSPTQVDRSRRLDDDSESSMSLPDDVHRYDVIKCLRRLPSFSGASHETVASSSMSQRGFGSSTSSSSTLGCLSTLGSIWLHRTGSNVSTSSARTLSSSSSQPHRMDASSLPPHQATPGGWSPAEPPLRGIVSSSSSSTCSSMSLTLDHTCSPATVPPLPMSPHWFPVDFDGRPQPSLLLPTFGAGALKDDQDSISDEDDDDDLRHDLLPTSYISSCSLSPTARQRTYDKDHASSRFPRSTFSATSAFRQRLARHRRGSTPADNSTAGHTTSDHAFPLPPSMLLIAEHGWGWRQEQERHRSGSVSSLEDDFLDHENDAEHQRRRPSGPASPTLMTGWKIRPTDSFDTADMSQDSSDSSSAQAVAPRVAAVPNKGHSRPLLCDQKTEMIAAEQHWLFGTAAEDYPPVSSPYNQRSSWSLQTLLPKSLHSNPKQPQSRLDPLLIESSDDILGDLLTNDGPTFLSPDGTSVYFNSDSGSVVLQGVETDPFLSQEASLLSMPLSPIRTREEGEVAFSKVLLSPIDRIDAVGGDDEYDENCTAMTDATHKGDARDDDIFLASKVRWARDGMATASSSEVHGPLLVTVHQLSYEEQANVRIVILILHIPTRKFEFVHVEYGTDADERLRISDVLKQLPRLISNRALRRLRFGALCWNGTELLNNMTLQDYALRDGDTLIAVTLDAIQPSTSERSEVLIRTRTGVLVAGQDDVPMVVGRQRVLYEADQLLKNKRLRRAVRRAKLSGRALQRLLTSDEINSQAICMSSTAGTTGFDNDEGTNYQFPFMDGSVQGKSAHRKKCARGQVSDASDESDSGVENRMETHSCRADYNLNSRLARRESEDEARQPSSPPLSPKKFRFSNISSILKGTYGASEHRLEIEDRPYSASGPRLNGIVAPRVLGTGTQMISESASNSKFPVPGSALDIMTYSKNRIPCDVGANSGPMIGERDRAVAVSRNLISAPVGNAAQSLMNIVADDIFGQFIDDVDPV